MSWSIYDTLREQIALMNECTDHRVADELLVDTLDEVSRMLSVYFPSLDNLTDSLIAEWRKKHDL